ncbi:peptide-methionine (S)-S-oxide reductase MsrA [Pseudomonas graminis]
MVSVSDKSQPVDQGETPVGRTTPMAVSSVNVVTEHSMTETPEGMAVAILGMGCFWGVERLYWQQEGVWSTASGYSGGVTPHPIYSEMRSGLTGHAEVVRVIFDPAVISYERLLQLFWENHDPAKGIREGSDQRPQYRSVIFTLDAAQAAAAELSRDRYQQAMAQAGDTTLINTEIAPAQTFYYAEDYHQQYLHKNPEGFCGLGGIGVCSLPQL